MMVEKVLKRFKEEVNNMIGIHLWTIFRAMPPPPTGASEVSSLEEARAEKVGGAEPSPGPLLI
jgi:hypothetical protein